MSTTELRHTEKIVRHLSADSRPMRRNIPADSKSSFVGRWEKISLRINTKRFRVRKCVPLELPREHSN